MSKIEQAGGKSEAFYVEKVICFDCRREYFNMHTPCDKCNLEEDNNGEN